MTSIKKILKGFTIGETVSIQVDLSDGDQLALDLLLIIPAMAVKEQMKTAEILMVLAEALALCAGRDPASDERGQLGVKVYNKATRLAGPGQEPELLSDTLWWLLTISAARILIVRDEVFGRRNPDENPERGAHNGRKE